MDLLKLFLGKTTALPAYITMAIIAICIAVGLYFKHFTEHVDSQIEQISEIILDHYGVDVDFSEDKKLKQEM